jgi:hypothetical protein
VNNQADSTPTRLWTDLSCAALCAAASALCCCLKGPGWCQKGFYCGRDYRRADQSDDSLRCLQAPPDCGKAGKPCCPSNTDTPNTKGDDIFRDPFCRDGSTCFSPNQRGLVPDFYIGQLGEAHPLNFF